MKIIMKSIQIGAIMLFLIPGLFYPVIVTAQVCEYNYASGNVKGRSYVGGLAGRNASPEGKIANSYARGQVTGETHVGGLAGSCNGTVENSYSTGKVAGNAITGGLTGSGNPSVSASYWDTQTSLQSTSAGGTGRSSDDMTFPYASNTFSAWDFPGTWIADASPFQNGGYPMLLTTPVCRVTLQVYPPGAGSVTGDGYYKVNQQVQLGASPDDAFVFKSWTKGNDLISTLKQYTMPVIRDVQIVARFESKATRIWADKPLPEPTVKIYPNPVKELLQVGLSPDMTGVTDVSVINMLGQTVVRFCPENKDQHRFSFSVAELKPGLYIIRIAHKGDYFSDRFVK